jgi:hypothetical protein
MKTVRRGADKAISPTPWRPFLPVTAQPSTAGVLRMRSMNMEGYKLEADQLRSDTLSSVSGRCRHYTSLTFS